MSELKRKAIDELLFQRKSYKEQGNYVKADEIRQHLNTLGITVQDTATNIIANGGTEYELKILKSEKDFLNYKINFLEYSLSVHNQREFDYNKIIGSLVTELLTAKYGKQES